MGAPSPLHYGDKEPVYTVTLRLAPQEGRLTPSESKRIKKYTKGFAHGEYFFIAQLIIFP